MHNSWVDFSTSTSLYNGLDLITHLGVESEVDNYTPNEDGNEYKETLSGIVELGYNGHSIKGGYDNPVLNKIFNQNLKSNLDVGYTENPIGEALSNRDYFGEYSFTIMSTEMGVGVIKGGNYYVSVNSYQQAHDNNPYFEGMELGAVIFEDVDNDGAGMFFTGTATLNNEINVSVGAGTIANEFSYTVSANYVMNEYLGLSATSIGSEGQSIASAGVELAYDNFITYLDFSADLNDDKNNVRENRMAFGFKVVF